jgi:hypothetical protein
VLLELELDSAAGWLRLLEYASWLLAGAWLPAWLTLELALELASLLDSLLE